MKKLLTILAGAIFFISATACTPNLGTKQEVTPTTDVTVVPTDIIATTIPTVIPTILVSEIPTILPSIAPITQTPVATQKPNITYKNGTFIGYGNSSLLGNDKAIVTINKGKITKVRIMSIDRKGKETRNIKNNKVLSKLEADIIRLQVLGIISNDIVISNARLAVTRALEKARTTTQAIVKYKNGIYKAYDNTKAKNKEIKATVKVVNNKIEDVTFEKLNTSGKAVGFGTLKSNVTAYENKIINNQSATINTSLSTLKKCKLAVENALKNAKVK